MRGLTKFTVHVFQVQSVDTSLGHFLLPLKSYITCILLAIIPNHDVCKKSLLTSSVPVCIASVPLFRIANALILSVEFKGQANNLRDKYRSQPPASDTTPAKELEELDFLQSDFFKIILKDPHGPQLAENVEPAARSCFFVHKELLASLSPELEKHVKNDMREGREGEMEVGEVEAGTMKAFLFWVYKDDYYA